MNDKIIKVSDIPPFQIALNDEAIANSPYARIYPPLVNAVHNLPVTGIIAKIGASTVSICRLNQNQLDWIKSLPGVSVLGSGDPYIKEMSDVIWAGAGKGLYHAIHLQTPREVDDGEGGTSTITPPLLHCVLAS